LFLSFYQALLNSILSAVSQLNELYTQADVADAAQILSFLCEHGQFFCENPFDWFIPAVLRSADLFLPMSRLITKYLGTQNVVLLVSKILMALIPPVEPDIIYEDIFRWVMVISQTHGRCFDESLFLEIFFLRSITSDLRVYFEKFESFGALFLLLIKRQECVGLTENYIEKFIEMAEEAVPALFRVFEKMLSESLTLLLIERINQPGARMFLEKLVDERPSLFVDVFGRHRVLWRLEGRIKFFLSIVKKAVLATKSRFFDDWVLSQPRKSSVFQCQGGSRRTRTIQRSLWRYSLPPHFDLNGTIAPSVRLQV
jgi:hypothetical protein